MAGNDENEELGAIGFMFDSMHEKIVKEITISSQSRDISLSLTLIGEDPGHRQSGHYLWPAAQFLASYLAQNWGKCQASFVIELGSGIGLCGILSCHLGDRTQQVVLTDYDPGCLDLLKINIQTNNCQDNCRAQFLQWGGENLQEVLLGSQGRDDVLLIGSDLLYCKEVVEPLFRTISQLLMHREGIRGHFLLASSFDVGEVSHPTRLYPLPSPVLTSSLTSGCESRSLEMVQPVRVRDI
jgi:predicted nicotinamide N-methyase